MYTINEVTVVYNYTFSDFYYYVYLSKLFELKISIIKMIKGVCI